MLHFENKNVCRHFSADVFVDTAIRSGLVGAGKDDAAVGGLAGEDAAAFLGGSIVGNAADGGFGELLDALFGLGSAVPMA